MLGYTYSKKTQHGLAVSPSVVSWQKLALKEPESATGCERSKEELSILHLRCSVSTKNLLFLFKHKKKRYLYTTPNHFCNTLLLFECPCGCSFEFIFTSASQFSFTLHFSKGYNWYNFFCGAKNLWHGTGAVNAKLCFYKYLLEFESRYWDISNFPCILK